MRTAVCMQRDLCGNGRCHFLGKLRNRSHYVIITNTTITLLQLCNRHKKSPTQSIVLGKTNCEGLYKDGLDYDQFDLIGQLSPSHHIFYRQLNSNRQPIYLRIQWFYWQQQGRSGIGSSYFGKKWLPTIFTQIAKKPLQRLFSLDIYIRIASISHLQIVLQHSLQSQKSASLLGRGKAYLLSN